MLNMMATFAKYEHELIQERVQAGIDIVRARGMKLGRPSPDLEKVAQNLQTVKHLIETEGLGVVEAARTVGCLGVTYYRHRVAQISS